VLFERHYPTLATGESPSLRATRAYVEAIGAWADYSVYVAQNTSGARNVLGRLSAEEANLLHSRTLAQAHGWWEGVIGTMQGLRTLYRETQRRMQWARLVAEIVEEFIDPATDGPLPGREEAWGLVTEYRASLALDDHRRVEAERLQKMLVDWNRERATQALAVPAEALDSAQSNAIRTLAVSLEALGNNQRLQGRAECVETYEKVIRLCRHCGDRPEEQVAPSILGMLI